MDINELEDSDVLLKNILKITKQDVDSYELPEFNPHEFLISTSNEL